MAVNRTQASLNQETAVLVADFLCKQLPVNYHVGWDNESSSAGIAGCELLAALGYATLTAWGAEPVLPPAVPSVLPRWDDTCLALLYLADRDDLFGQGLSPMGPRILIQRNYGDGIHAADPEFLNLLECLGAVEEGRWTQAAEPVLWRYLPFLQPMPDFSDEPRIVEIAQLTIAAQPEDVAERIAAAMANDSSFLRGLLVREILSRRWRYPEGWLAVEVGAPRTLHIQHDAVAAWMACRLIGSRTV